MKKTGLPLALYFFFNFCLFAQDNSVSEFFNDMRFRNVGPSRGGRVTAVAGIKSDPSTYYMGSTGGGVWKTNDYGRSWQNVSDGYFTTGSVGAIRVCQDNPDIVYVGTGSDAIRSNVIKGRGVYKSIDGGLSWSFLGLGEAGQIGAVIIDPENPDRVFAAAIGNPFGPNSERGVFRTNDGGETWDKVLYISDSTGICDLEFHPGNPEIIYASAWTVRRKPWTIISGSEEGGIFRSVDGGDNWEKLGGGLPEGVVGKSDLAVCDASPEILYVLVEAAGDRSGLYISSDMGESFKLVSSEGYLLDRPFYYTNIDVDPADPDVLYSNSTGFYKSEDRGQSWERIQTPHGDNHDMWINPLNTNIFIQSNDGGANITLNGGVTWSSQDNQPTAELYQVNVDDQVPYWLYAGQQDNSTLAIPSTSVVGSRRRDREAIMSVGGCETGPAVPKPGNHNIVYSNCKGRFGRFNKITGEERQYYVGAANMYGHNPADLKYRFQRVSPIIVSPHDPGIVYHASQYLHKTTDEGVTWETISPDLTAFEADKQVISGSPITRDITGEEFYSTIYALAESPLVKGLLWTGANDGPVYVSRDGGVKWQEVTPAGLPSGGRVQTIEASPHRAAKTYIAVYRYLLDDWQPYIYKTEDYGETWEKICAGIPVDEPVRVIREDPEKEGLLYAGTESGVYISFDDGASWKNFNLNLPSVVVTDIRVCHDDLVISTMGRSFWILDDINPLREAKKIKDGRQTTLFTPADAFRLSEVTGVGFSYYLENDFDSLTLRIENGNKETLAILNDTREVAGKGFHRISWNMRIKGVDMHDRRSIVGPLVVPGRYRVILTAGRNNYISSFDILPDPQKIADGMTLDDYKKQFELSRDIAGLINKSFELTDLIEASIEDTADNGLKRRGSSFRRKKEHDQLLALKSKLESATYPYSRPMLNDQLRYLYYMLNRADQLPGKDAYLRYDELKNQFEKLKKEYEELISLI